MAHLLLMDVPGGNDFAVMADALASGHQVTFCTSDLSVYRSLDADALAVLARAHQIVDGPGVDESSLMARLEAIHTETPFDAVLCLLDIRLYTAAWVARHFGLRFLKPDVALLCRDKTAVRRRLAERGIVQSGFAQASSPEEVREALDSIGYPAIAKPSDGYGSESLFMISGPDELEATLEAMFCQSNGVDYGLGVRSKGLYSIEPYMQGQLIGIEVFTDDTQRRVLGVNAKKMYPLPSFAIAGSCFPSDQFDPIFIQQHAFAVLDALDFNFGAAHIEAIVDDNQFYLVEVNARLVTANIPFQMAHAFDRSIYDDLINLHLGMPLSTFEPFERHAFSVIRWIVVDRPGRLATLELPEMIDPHIQRIVTFKSVGDEVRPPMSNNDRIGYVIATAPTEAEATRIAEAYIRQVTVRISECISIS